MPSSPTLLNTLAIPAHTNITYYYKHLHQVVTVLTRLSLVLTNRLVISNVNGLRISLANEYTTFRSIVPTDARLRSSRSVFCICSYVLLVRYAYCKHSYFRNSVWTFSMSTFYNGRSVPCKKFHRKTKRNDSRPLVVLSS